MQYLFDSWARLSKKLKETRHHLFLFDFDGTLAPIVKSPARALLDKKTRDLLNVLSKKPYCSIGVVSGRSLIEVRRRIGLPRFIYAGNHGLEASALGFHFVHPLAKACVPSMKNMAVHLKKDLRLIRGVKIENKGLTLSVHYRQLERSHQKKFRAYIENSLVALCRSKNLIMKEGKKVIDILPDISWDKGKTVFMLRARIKKPCQTWFIGDDTTDEDVFRQLSSPDVTVRVGQKRFSRASYYLKNQGETKLLLEKLIMS